MKHRISHCNVVFLKSLPGAPGSLDPDKKRIVQVMVNRTGWKGYSDVRAAEGITSSPSSRIISHMVAS